MSEQGLVSAIMIFLNGEEFMHEAIASIFAQTYENWEILLVDDGSTDSSSKIAQQYAAKYPDKVRYLEHEGHQNCGMSASRNLGIRKAKGEYITFLDADDVWLPEKLTKQVARLNSQPEAGVVFGPTQYWYSWTGNPGDIKQDCIRKIGVQPNRLFQPPELFLLFMERRALTPATCSILLRREVFERIGGFEESFRGLYEDQAFFSKLYLNISAYVEDEYLDRYRQHQKSSCAVAVTNGKYHRFMINPAQLNFFNWLSQYLSEQKVEDERVWRALRQSLWPYEHPRLYLVWYPFQRVKDRIRRALQP